MDITVTGRRMNVSDALRDYAEEKIGNSMKAMDIAPLSAEVVLQVEKNPANPTRCTCEVTMHANGHIIRVEENEESLFAAIDVAAAKVLRQLRKYKTRVLNKRLNAEPVNKQATDVDYDALMQELSGEDEEIVRVKELELLPLTEEEAAHRDRSSGSRLLRLYRSRHQRSTHSLSSFEWRLRPAQAPGISAREHTLLRIKTTRSPGSFSISSLWLAKWEC